jgi:transcriptional regulator GlxA family with amidase domain
MQNFPPRDSLYAKALRLFALRVGDGLVIKDVCRILGVSRSTLWRQFMDTAGRTPTEEFVRIRVERAMDLLVNTELPIKRIAILSGYRQVSHFGDFFRRQTGLSPRAFRQCKDKLADIPAAETTQQEGPVFRARKNILRSCDKVRTESVC